MFFRSKPAAIPTAEKALTGRPDPLPTAEAHFVTGRPLKAAPPSGYETLYLGLGCFWGAERVFWEADGVWLTAVGYGGGHTPNATYEEVCSGRTGHTELVKVIYDPDIISTNSVLTLFWEAHNPTQGMRQGNDIGTQYRSALYTTTEAQNAVAQASKAAYQSALQEAGLTAPITTEIAPTGPFYYAEDYHQQYLAKNPNGYCGLGGTGVSCPINLGMTAGETAS